MTDQHCALHCTPLIEDYVPVIYGTFAPEPAHVVAERMSKYPFANATARGPCWVESRTHATVLFCPVCREVWRTTPEARQLADYLAQERPSVEEEIARLRAQQDQNRRYALILSTVQTVFYVLLGSILGTALCYFAHANLALGATLGGAGGAIFAARSPRPNTAVEGTLRDKAASRPSP